MADYYTLIKRAVDRLSSDPLRGGREELYERARAAQIAQLHAIVPPLSAAEIDSEQLELEEAVRRVEAELAEPPRVALHISALSNLVAAAEDIGRRVGREDTRRTSASIAPKEPASPHKNGEVPLPMIFRGGGTGRLTRYWRWRSSTSSSENRAAGR
jgi:hypothetical protein